MARRVNNSERMGAFKRKQHDIIKNSIASLADRYCGLQTVELNSDDLMEMFVEPELREPAKAAFKQFSVNTIGTIECPFSLAQYGKGSATLTPNTPIKWAKPAKFNPRSPSYVNAGASGYKRLVEWAEWRVEAGLKWGLVMAVYNHLRVICADPKTVRYLWPAVVPLLGRDELADKLRVPKEPPFIPTMSRELGIAIADTNALVAGTLILPEQDDRDDPPVMVSLSVGQFTGKRPWDGGNYICL